MNEERIATFSERLKEYMQRTGTKAIDLAKRFNVSRSTISQYTSGKVIPKRDRLVEIADTLNISPLWLMGYNVPITPQSLHNTFSMEEEAVVVAYRNSSEDIKNAVCAVLGVKRGSGSIMDAIIS